VVGHYARPDLFHLEVNNKAQRPVVFAAQIRRSVHEAAA